MKPLADDLRAIWNAGRASALTALLRGGTSANERENILYSAWSETIGQMMDLIPPENDWRTLSMEKQLEVMKGKTFSLQKFQDSIYDPQFGLLFDQDLPH